MVGLACSWLNGAPFQSTGLMMTGITTASARS